MIIKSLKTSHYRIPLRTTIPDDVKGHARIATEGGLPIATGENLRTIYEFRNMIEYGRVAYPEPDVSNIGGITNWMRVANLAYANSLPVTTHGVHELHLHLLAAVPNASYLEVHCFGLERFIINPPELSDGVMTVSDKPGHGVNFDWQALEAFYASPSAGSEFRMATVPRRTEVTEAQ